jgi:hypothetical protein
MVTGGLVTQRLYNMDHDGYRKTENKLTVTYFRIYFIIYLGKFCKPTKHITYGSPQFT